MDGERLMLETRLVHSSGEWVGCIYPVCKLADHQDMGSALTYARRYSYCAIAGIAAEEDDDGNSAAEPTAKPTAPKEKVPPRMGEALRKQAATSPTAERNAKPARGGYGRQKNNVDAVGAGPSGAVVDAAGEPVAETLLAGIPHTDTQVGREGLREIVSRIMQARKQVGVGFNPEK